MFDYGDRSIYIIKRTILLLDYIGLQFCTIIFIITTRYAYLIIILSDSE